ncbi:hypothetical protein AVEN_24806-1 [Araneus ventricosus]|uniref:Uncharacterized protein n=1 Tax=Araneus ventricosus TaxID=182803 RepID=A0A4Y2BWT3_ARAVE|nr:hypothetical protein AVEN_24806-1 [Araneus ventricosus]
MRLRQHGLRNIAQRCAPFQGLYKRKWRVCYEGEFFPGKIVSTTENGANIISMERTLNSWKWHSISYVKEYLWEDVLERIGTPKRACRRGFYSVSKL